MTCEFVQVHYIFISEMIPTILQIQFLHAMAQQNHTGSSQVCDKEISICPIIFNPKYYEGNG